MHILCDICTIWDIVNLHPVHFWQPLPMSVERLPVCLLGHKSNWLGNRIDGDWHCVVNSWWKIWWNLSWMRNEQMCGWMIRNHTTMENGWEKGFFLLTLIYLMNFCVRIFLKKYNDEAEKKNKNGPKLGTMGNVFEWTIG